MEQLGALLDGSLSAHGAARAQCEAQLTQALRAPGFALQLAEFLFTPSATSVAAQRQLACILLKKLVRSFWTLGGSEDDDDDDDDDGKQAALTGPPYVVADHEKAAVRAAIVASLQRGDVLLCFTESKLQTALCMAVAAIFERDWPDQWPDLLPVVLAMVAGQDRLAIAVAVRLLSLASAHFSSEHCCELVAVVSPPLQRIFAERGDTTVFPVGVRARIVRILENSLVMVGMEAQVGNGAAQQLLQGHMTQWMTLLLQELQAPSVSSATEDAKTQYALKIQVLTTLAKFVEEWPSHMAALLPDILPVVQMLLQSSLARFEQDVVLSADGEEDAYDSDADGVRIGASALVVASLEFLRATLHAPTKKTRTLVAQALPELVYLVIGFMQITASQVENWAADANQYVADEDDDSLADSIRNVAMDVLSETEAVLGRRAVSGVLQASQRRLHDASSDSWRVQEAALLCVGTVASPILALASSSQPEAQQALASASFELSSFLQTLFQVMQGAQDTTIYLRARALWCASRLAQGMPDDMLHAFLQLALSGLEPGQVLPVRLYSCRALGAIVKLDSGRAALSQDNSESVSAVVVERLVHLAAVASDETLHIALETLVVLLQELDGRVAPAVAAGCVSCFLQHWGTHLNDPLVAELLDGALAALLASQEEAIVANLHAQVLPVVRDLLVQSRSALGASGNGALLAASAITVLTTIVKHSFIATAPVAVSGSAQAEPQPPAVQAMSAQLVQLVVEPLVGVLSTVDDDRVLTAGTECLKWMVMFAVDALRGLQFQDGRSGVDATMQVAAQLLAPSVDEACAVGVGGLITQLLLQLGNTLPRATIESMLTAVAHKLAHAELPSLVQSLCMVFARLVHTHGRELLDLLEQMPTPPGTEAKYANLLAFVMSTWIEKQLEFYGSYCIKVTVSALLKVAEWQDPRVTQLVVMGSRAEAASTAGEGASGNGMRTRSKTKSSGGASAAADAECLRVHFVTKLVVVLAKVSAHLGEEEEEEWESSDDEEDDEEDDDEEHGAGGAGPSSAFAPAEDYELLSDRLDGADAHGAMGEGDGEDEVEEAFEAHFDPLNEVDLKSVITVALQAVTANAELVQAIVPELTPADHAALTQVTTIQ